MLTAFKITAPLPVRNSATALRKQLVDHFLRIGPTVGERFLSDHELSRISQLSRPTVRRALDSLEREGWIQRQPGVGTFIGPRARVAEHLRNHHAHPEQKRTVRVALLIHMLGDLRHDWYAAGVMQGIDQAAEECGVSLELLGDRRGDAKTTSRRLGQSRPDVLALAAPSLRHATLIGEARRLDIPCIGTGTLMASLGLPCVCEDGEDGAQRAVQHLIDRGHQRIGFITPTFALPWVFQRRLGFFTGLERGGLEPDEGMVLWLDYHDQPLGVQLLQRYLKRRRPTAIILSSWTAMEALASLIRAGEIKVPRDLSVVCFDQHPSMSTWLGDIEPTTIDMPLLEMGTRLAQMARRVVEGQELESVVTLPCSLVEGESVAPPRSD